MTICIIPARSGSQRIPHKNRKLFHGKPIILYSIETAQKSGLFDEIIVSTDDPDIFEIAMAHGATGYMRPEHLAVDEIGTQAVAKDVLEQVDTEYACVLYATSPLLSVERLEFGYVVASSLDDSLSYAYSCDRDGNDAGCFYFGKTKSFVDDVPLAGNSVCIALPPERVCDINVMADWHQAEAMFEVLYET